MMIGFVFVLPAKYCETSKHTTSLLSIVSEKIAFPATVAVPRC